MFIRHSAQLVNYTRAAMQFLDVIGTVSVSPQPPLITGRAGAACASLQLSGNLHICGTQKLNSHLS